MLQTAPSQIQPPTMRRGHAHKRSAAISGDFDLDFFKRGPSIGETLAGSQAASLPTESYMNRPSHAPSVVVTAPDEEQKRASHSIEATSSQEILAATTPSPKKKHTRLNSWAHSLIKTKPKEVSSATSKLEYNSSSNDTTPENARTSRPLNYSYASTSSSTIKAQKYQIPEAIIDLDLAGGIHYDPAASVVPTKTKEIFHRRTESAPELEDFFKYKTMTSSSAKNSRRNSAIFEEEEDEEGALSSTSSENQALNKNPSTNSLNSNHSSGVSGHSGRVQSPNPYHSLTSTPTSTKTRRGGATAARYQSYYNNNLMLANALKSSESLSQITGINSLHKPSYSSMQSQKSALVTPTSLPHSVSSSSASSVNSSLLNSPSRFKFESKVYDMPPGQYPGYAHDPSLSNTTSTPKAKSTSISTTTSPSKRSVTKSSTKTHKKSNSLLNSLSVRIRGGSFSSLKGKDSELVQDDTNDDYNDEETEGDSTLTPLNFGEPGPALDLTTMTPKFYDDYDHKTTIPMTGAQTKPATSHAAIPIETPKKSRKSAFLNWMKK